MAIGKSNEGNGRKGHVRYAVVGLGYIAQAAVLPAFAHAKGNSRLTALISSDPVKLRRLGRKYDVSRLYSYDDYEIALQGGEFDAVYIALPNSMHASYTIRAARRGIHVLCEKPMAVQVQECAQMIAAAREHDVRLMIAYRLHFEAANLEAIKVLQSDKIGEPRFFNAVFSLNVKPGDIRVQQRLGGGPLYDIGIYCINAARYLFRDEPASVIAFGGRIDDERFADVPESVSAVLRFPGDRLASFTCSFNGGDVSAFRVVGTRGDLHVEPAFDYAAPLKHRLTVRGKSRSRSFGKRDQFAPELIHFSDCVLTGRDPGPSGEEGLADIRIIQAIHASMQTGQAVSVPHTEPATRPSMEQEIHKRAVRKPELVHAASPSKDGD